VTPLGTTLFLEAMSISPHTHAPDGGLCENEEGKQQTIEHQVSKKARCDGLMLREGVARLKREQIKRLKLSLLVFFLGFIGFFLVFVKL